MLRILVVTEDGSKDAHATLLALIKNMLRVVDGRCHTNQIAFEPPAEQIALIARANAWKSTKGKDRHKVVSLVRTIATKLAEPQGVVMFYIDGDRAWSQRHASENLIKLRHIIIDKVRALLAARHQEWPAEELDQRMKRLCPLVPFYSIEAWV